MSQLMSKNDAVLYILDRLVDDVPSVVIEFGNAHRLNKVLGNAVILSEFGFWKRHFNVVMRKLNKTEVNVVACALGLGYRSISFN